MALTLAACGTDPTAVDYCGMSYAELKETAESMATSLATSSVDDLTSALTSDQEYAKQYAKQYGREYTEAEALISLLESWLDATADVGDYEGLGDFSVSKASDTVTVDQIVHFTGRDVDISIVYEYSYLNEELEMSDATADVVYSLGEKMQKATFNTLMGMGTVLAVLFVICIIIYCMEPISKLGAPKEKKEPKKKEAQTRAAVPAQPIVQPAAAPASPADTELAAVIAAAIAAGEGVSPDTFVVRSIHRR